MKRRTTRKKQQELIKEQKNYLTDMIVGIVVSVLFIMLFFVAILMYNQKPLTYQYEDVEYKQFTFESFETINVGKSGICYYMYVEEEELPLIIDSVTASYKMKQKLYNIKEGDIISCYVKPNSGKFSYTIVELKSDEMIFSLDYYNEQNKRNGLIGLIAMPICAIASLIFTLVFATKYKKLKNANP